MPDATIVVAHFGGAHWFNYVLVAVPLLVVSGLALASSMRERRERRRPKANAGNDQESSHPYEDANPLTEVTK